MNWFIDFVLLAVLAVYSFRYFRNGLMHTVYSVAKFLVSLIIAVLFGKLLGNLLADYCIGRVVTEQVYGKLVDFTGGGESLAEFFANIPDGFVRFAELFKVDVAMLQEKYGALENSEEVLQGMAETISAPIVNAISAVIGYVVVFVVAYIVLTVVVAGLKKIKIPILTGIDKALGLVLGLALGLFNASLIATAVYFALEYFAAMNSDSTIMNVYSNSYIFRFIYDLKIFEFIRNLI